MTVNGWLGREGDVDTYRVHARAGRDLVVSIVAAPLGSMTDTTVSVLSPDGHELASNDDFRDSATRWSCTGRQQTAPLLVRVTDANAAGGWRHLPRHASARCPS